MTSVLDNDEPGIVGSRRVHQVQAAQIPPFEDVEHELINPHLRRGDVVLMHGFTWHYAPANGADSSGRTGLYMKFRAASSPPAAGPLLFASEVATSLVHSHIMPYHRQDGSQIVDEGRLVLEHEHTNTVWAVPCGSDAAGWRLPHWKIVQSNDMVSATTAAWDAGNIIGELQTLAYEDFGVLLPWMSWIADSKQRCASQGTSENLCRVYGHLLNPGDSLPARGGMFVDPTALPAAEREWVRQWVEQIDSRGRSVRRGIGVPRHTTFSYDRPGKQAGTYRVGAFERGKPALNLLT